MKFTTGRRGIPLATALLALGGLAVLASAAPAYRPARAAPAQVTPPAGPGLTKAALDASVIVRDADAALRFYRDGLGLSYRGDAQSAPGLRMLLFQAGESTVKVRVYDDPPPGREGAVIAANGWRFISLRVPDLAATSERLAALGFTRPAIEQVGGTRLAWVQDADGNAIELAEAPAGSRWGLGLGLLSADAVAARAFLADGLGLTETQALPGLPVAGDAGVWFAAEGSAIRVYAPAGERPTYAEGISDARGYRYVTFNVADVDAVHERLRARGVEIPVPISTYRDVARLFMARGPGGALFEFIGPAAGTETATAPAGTLTATARPSTATAGTPPWRTRTPTPGTPGAPTREPPEAHPPADRAFLDLAFSTDYHAARQPSGGLLSETSECNALAVHRGMLFAGTSWFPTSGATTDPKLLVKKSAGGPWQVEHRAGSAFMRLGMLESIAFTTDARGNRLPEPVPVLVAGLGSWRSQNPDGVYVLSRDDDTGSWVTHKLTDRVWNPQQWNHATEVRQVFDHVDRVTGVHHVFAGSAIGSLFRGAYDPSAPGKIVWDPEPELSGLLGHFVAGAAEVDGVLYAGVAFGPRGDEPLLPTDRPVQDHGLFRRIDGPDARWEWVPVPAWEDPARPGFSLRTAQLRGLTAVPDPAGTGRDVLLLAWDTRDAVIERVDPHDGFQVTVELDVRAYFRQAWGRTVGVSTFAYNEMLPARHPDTGEAVHLIGLWLVDPNGEGGEIGKSSWYLVRYADAAYGYGRIYDPADRLADLRYGLRGARSFRPSPFADEAERVWYVCGFDQTGIGEADARGSTAWVYRARLPEPSQATPTPTPSATEVAVPGDPGRRTLFLPVLLCNAESIAPAATGIPPGTTASAASTATATPSPPVTATRLAQPDGFVVDDVRVGAADVGYFDPEFLSEVDRMVFQTSYHGVQQVWIAELNPLTGLLVSATGRDLLVDTGAATIGPQFDTTNGPEWGLDREGAAIFYSKRDTNDVVQCWRASNLIPGGVTAAPLTHLKGPDGEGAIMVIARKDVSRPTTQFIYRYIPAPRFRTGGPARWADETAPDAVHDVPRFNGAAAAPSWIEGTEDFVYAMFVAPEASEITRYNTASGTTTVLTSHPGAKHNVHAFKAPELNGELLVGSVIDRTRFTVFRSDSTRYVPWAELVPPDPAHPYMLSPEMFQAGGVTYFAVQMSSHIPDSLGTLPQDVDCAMWMMGLGKDASQRVARRVDDGAVSGTKAYRSEPEVYVGANEVFLFYNIGNTLHRTRTGIRVDAASKAPPPSPHQAR